ncbi:GNAT family N-acetyltransferase [Alkalicaulis satelles]|uniref:GNAT family N-acetyltransferase n=1 Tax=Alkalicaulis satelles TaxID=2609175 RepID=A0A5M6ZFR8_9PROT|nr:GNAT family N-acetyltransferase [Alkalicaulis satelles]KAA5803596.1 GNAT family N-acetyltransferase [Alkalicaulis satelles]
MTAAPETRPDAPPDRITARLALRPMRLADAPFLAREGGRPDVARMVARIPAPMPVLSAEMFILIMRAREDAGHCQVRLITRRQDGTPLGVIGLHGRKAGSRDLGYWLAREHWGRGYISEAAAAMVDLARARGFTRLTAGHFADNPASGRVLEKLGFAYIDNGQTTPMYCLGRLASVPHRAMALPIGLKTG